MNAVEKIKGYYKEHEFEIKTVASVTALSIGLLMVGYIMGDKVSDAQHAR